MSQMKKLEEYIEEYSNEQKGITIIEKNEEGTNNIPDETKEYSRLEFLQENEEIRKIWTVLAEQEYQNRKPKENEELVYVRIPSWFIQNEEDNPEWYNTLNTHTYGQFFENYAMIRKDVSEGKNAWSLTAFKVDSTWASPRNKYRMLWIPRSCITVYMKKGTPRPVDKEAVSKTDALPDEKKSYEVDEDDIDWRLALAKAFQRTNDSLGSPLDNKISEAKKELPEKSFMRLEVAVNEFKKQKYSLGNPEIDEEELIMLIDSFLTAMEPNGLKKHPDYEPIQE